MANFSNVFLREAFYLEMWCGANFNFSMRFLHKFPWKHLKTLREKVPDSLFHMLLCGANSVGYTNYPDVAVHKFCTQASKSSVDVFCVLDYLNYIDNLKLVFDVNGSASGFF